MVTRFHARFYMKVCFFFFFIILLFDLHASNGFHECSKLQVSNYLLWIIGYCLEVEREPHTHTHTHTYIYIYSLEKSINSHYQRIFMKPIVMVDF